MRIIKEFEEVFLESVRKEMVEGEEERLKKLGELLLCEKEDEKIYGSFRRLEKFEEKKFKKLLSNLHHVKMEVRVTVWECPAQEIFHFTPPWWKWLEEGYVELRESFVDFKRDILILSPEKMNLCYEKVVNVFCKDYGNFPWEEKWEWIGYRQRKRRKLIHLWRSYCNFPQIVEELLIKL
jgi:alpha-N-acetylglucosamine transferase